MDPQETLFQLNPGDEGVFRRQNEEPFDPSNIGNPYPYGMDPVSTQHFTFKALF